MTSVTDDRHPSGSNQPSTGLTIPDACRRAGSAPTLTDRTYRRLGALLAGACLALASCGGGSSSPTEVSGAESAPQPPPAAADPQPAPYTIQGSLRVGEAQTVDADTNDPNQGGRRSNNAFATAQRFPNPGLASGYLTLQGLGPDGAVKTGGDLVDGYRAYLQPGQVIELDFTADVAQADVDLYLYDSERQVIGVSAGVGSYECIRITREGEYVIAAHLIADESTTGTIYQMRVGRPAATRCGNVQRSARSIDPDGIVAIADPRDPSPLTVVAKAQNAHLTVRHPGGPSGRSAMLIDLPASDRAMARALASHAKPVVGADAATVLRKAELAATGDPDWTADLSDQAKRVHAAVNLSRAMKRSGRYLAASPNVIVEPQADRLQTFPPNDPYYSYQAWHYDQISLPAAINRLVSFTPATEDAPLVAVVDSGIVADHPDLRSQLVAGFDFVSDVRNGDGDGVDPDPDDSVTTTGWSFHGTHVAGTVAAATYNDLGMAGVAPIARILPVRVLSNVSGYGSFFDTWHGIAYAAGLENVSGKLPARRADVINLSLGSSFTACEDTYQVLFDQLRSAGVWVVASAGNDSDPEKNLLAPVGSPANCDFVLAVGALDGLRQRASYSNIGPELAVVAPGGGSRVDASGATQHDRIYSTMAANEAGQRKLGWGGAAGTSMAAPHVSGVLALIRWINPQLRIETVEQWIREGRIVDDIGPAGRDDHYGHGLINAEKAVAVALESRGAGAQPPAGGVIVARPTSLHLGSLGQSVEVNLVLPGAGAEKVASVTTDSQAITVAPKAGAVDPASGLGTYVVTANRAAMAENTSAFPNVVVTLAPERVIKVQAGIERRAVSGGADTTAGAIYVLAVDASDETLRVVAGTAVAAPVQGVYDYQFTVPGTRRIAVIAGSDLDNDRSLCARGETCGSYPDLSRELRVLEPTGNLTGIDFNLLPVSAISAGSDVMRD